MSDNFSLDSSMMDAMELRDTICEEAYPAWERSYRMNEPYALEERQKALTIAMRRIKTPAHALAVLLTADPGDLIFSRAATIPEGMAKADDSGLSVDEAVAKHIAELYEYGSDTLIRHMFLTASAALYSRLESQWDKEVADRAKSKS